MILARSASVNLVAPSPYITAKRSPGSKRITKKMMIDTPKIVRTPKAARRSRYLCTLVTPSYTLYPAHQTGQGLILEPPGKPCQAQRTKLVRAAPADYYYLSNQKVSKRTTS